MADCLAMPLKRIFEASIRQRVYPSAWKTAIICPIPKTNPPMIEKFRPISLLPVVSKLFERIVLAQLWNKVDMHFGESQHGFRPGHSTTTAIIDLLETALSQYDDTANNGTVIISFDLSSAFDCIDHEMATRKFCQFQFPAGFSKWLCSYLTDRLFMVKICETFSRICPVSRGVPQGSVLGPSIFSVITSDLHTANTACKMVKYADDISVVVPMSKQNDTKTTILSEIRAVQEWCERNKLALNNDKTSILLCTSNTNALQLELPFNTSHETTILGVTINDSLTWSDHVSNIIKKCNRRFFILRKLKPYFNSDDLVKIYSAMIRSILEYASPCFVWLPKGLENRLRRIERRAFNIIDSTRQIRGRPIFAPELKARRETAAKKLFFKIANSKSHILHKYIPKRLKNTKQFNVKHTHTSKYQRSFFPYVTLLLNNYPFM